MNMTLRSSLPCWNYRASSKLLKRKTPFLRSKLNHVDQSRCLRCVKDTMGSVSQIRFYWPCYSQPSTGEPHQTLGNWKSLGPNIFGFNGLFVHPDRLSQKNIPKTLWFVFLAFASAFVVDNQRKKPLQNIISTPWRRGSGGKGDNLTHQPTSLDPQVCQQSKFYNFGIAS